MIYGQDTCLPTQAALSTLPTLQMLDVGDYKTELVTGLTYCWDIHHPDHHAKTPKMQTGDRVMVFMPHETKTKEHAVPWPIQSN